MIWKVNFKPAYIQVKGINFLIWKFKSIISFFFYILQELSKSEFFSTLFLLFQRVDENLIHKDILCTFVFTKLEIVILKNIHEILVKMKNLRQHCQQCFLFQVKIKKICYWNFCQRDWLGPRIADGAAPDQLRVPLVKFSLIYRQFFIFIL